MRKVGGVSLLSITILGVGMLIRPQPRSGRELSTSIYNELISITVITFMDIFLSFILIIRAWIEAGRIGLGYSYTPPGLQKRTIESPILNRLVQGSS
jgi:hypothetical protein